MKYRWSSTTGVKEVKITARADQEGMPRPGPSKTCPVLEQFERSEHLAKFCFLSWICLILGLLFFFLFGRDMIEAGDYAGYWRDHAVENDQFTSIAKTAKIVSVAPLLCAFGF